jgi:hypothetical protein
MRVQAGLRLGARVRQRYLATLRTAFMSGQGAASSISVSPTPTFAIREMRIT